VFCWLMLRTFRVREGFARFRTYSSSPCNSKIFRSKRKTYSFCPGERLPSKVSTFSTMVTLSFWLPLRSSIFPLPLLFESLGGGGSGGPLDMVWYADEARMHGPTFGNGINQKKQVKGNQVSKTK